MKLVAKRQLLLIQDGKKITIKKGEKVDSKLVGKDIKHFFSPVKEDAAKKPIKKETATK